MQSLARLDHLTGAALVDAQIAQLLVGDRLELRPGLELVNADLSAGQDISDDLLACKVNRSMYANIHGTCTLGLARELPWGAVLVRPYVVLSDGGITARFDEGVFALVTPERPLGPTPTVHTVEGLDRLYLLDREVGDAYEVADGVSYPAAMRQVVADAGLTGVIVDGTAEAKILPQEAIWPLVAGDRPTTWLRVFNDLAAAVNYRGAWADDLGRIRSEPYQAPADRAPEWTFDVDAITTIVGEDRTVVEDLWRAPNRWIFVQQNRTTVPIDGDGVYTVDNEHDGPSSQDARGGLVWPKQVKVDVADQASLVAYGDRVVAADLQVTTTVKATTGPFPVAGHFDVFTFADEAAGGNRKVVAVEWEMDLFATGVDAMRWKWEAV